MSAHTGRGSDETKETAALRRSRPAPASWCDVTEVGIPCATAAPTNKWVAMFAAGKLQMKRKERTSTSGRLGALLVGSLIAANTGCKVLETADDAGDVTIPSGLDGGSPSADAATGVP